MRMAPFSTVASVKATHAVMTSGSLRPQYVASWCQDTNAESRGPLMKKLVLHTRRFGPSTSSTASRMAG